MTIGRYRNARPSASATTLNGEILFGARAIIPRLPAGGAAPGRTTPLAPPPARAAPPHPPTPTTTRADAKRRGGGMGRSQRGRAGRRRTPGQRLRNKNEAKTDRTPTTAPPPAQRGGGRAMP